MNRCTWTGAQKLKTFGAIYVGEKANWAVAGLANGESVCSKTVDITLDQLARLANVMAVEPAASFWLIGRSNAGAGQGAYQFP